jgi:nitroimidazol reductase NimA-like FMN-containing flavoprotein (pyridoxamine 5'-phosphate oxidase superfamily)
MRYRGPMEATRPLSPSEATAALRLLDDAVYASLAMAEPEGPYLVPINFAYVEPATAPGDADPATAAHHAQAGRGGTGSLPGRIYFHTGEGRKTAALAADPRVCLAVVGSVTFRRGGGPCADAFSYRSLLVWGRAQRLEDEAARQVALRAIVAKYDPAQSAVAFRERDFAQTLLYELTIDAASYKQEPRG